MACGQIQVKTLDGYKRDITVCDDVPLPPNIKGMTNKKDKILINRYLSDLKEIGISKPKLYVLIHELYHIIKPWNSEYQTRVEADKAYSRITKESIDTTAYCKYADKAKGFLKRLRLY